MTTINTESIMPENQRLGRLINDLGELIARESIEIYQDIIVANFVIKRLSPSEEKDFLLKLYNCMVDKLKEIKF